MERHSHSRKPLSLHVQLCYTEGIPFSACQHCSVPLGTTHSALNSRRRQKKLVEVTDVTVLQKSPRGSIRMLRNNRHVVLYACSEITARTRIYMYYKVRIIPLIDGLGHATWSSIVDLERIRFSKIAISIFDRLLRWSCWYRSDAASLPAVRE